MYSLMRVCMYVACQYKSQSAIIYTSRYVVHIMCTCAVYV